MNQHLVSIDHEKLIAGLDQFKNANILVIGDIIVDHFIYGSVNRISPEAPVPVVNVKKETLLLGGSANVLHNLYSLGARGTICGIIGDDFMGEQFLTLLAEVDSPTTGVIRSDDRPTTKKTRVIAQNQQIVRFDREQTLALKEDTLKALYHFLDTHLEEYHAIVVSDYNKGVICKELMDHLRPLIKKHNIPMIVDPKPGHPEFFKGATIITPNNLETKLMSGMEISDTESLLTAATKLKNEIDSEAVLITRGEEGMALLTDDEPLFCIPTVAREVYDVTGAGDTVIATLAMGLAVGLTHKEAATLANYAAGIVVGKVGTATASKEELLEVLR